MLATIQQQRQECERLQSLPYISRRTRHDIPLLLQNLQIKFITGFRCAGKSIFALILSETLLYLGIDANAIRPEQESDARMAYEEYLRLGGYPETLQAHQMTGSYLLSNICNPFTTLSFCEDLIVLNNFRLEEIKKQVKNTKSWLIISLLTKNAGRV